jgi:hypothetical protein
VVFKNSSRKELNENRTRKVTFGRRGMLKAYYATTDNPLAVSITLFEDGAQILRALFHLSRSHLARAWRTILREHSAFGHVCGVSISFVEDVAAIDCCIRWGVHCLNQLCARVTRNNARTVQRHSVSLCVWVGDAVQSEFIGHVRNLIDLVRLLGDHLHVAILTVVEIDSRPCIACLSEAALENLHDAVSVGMAVSCQ